LCACFAVRKKRHFSLPAYCENSLFYSSTVNLLTKNKVMFEELYFASCLTMLAAGLITILNGGWRG
jgi:hypothetical protein